MTKHSGTAPRRPGAWRAQHVALLLVGLALQPWLVGLWLRAAAQHWTWITHLHDGSLEPMPAYRLELRGGGLHDRPARGEALSLAADGTLSAALRPVTGAAGPIAVEAFLARGGRLRRWAVAPEHLGQGTFLLRAPVDELPDLAPGRWQIVFVIGRPGALPADADAMRRRPFGDRWQLLEGTLDIAPSG